MLSPSTDRSRWTTGALLVALLVIPGGLEPALAQDAGQTSTVQEKEQPGGADGEEATQDEETTEGTGSTAQEPATEGAVTETIEVVGYRQALQESVTLKRDAVHVRESIVTEDIGKMPDLNLAEAIQRLPGVAIVREGGEGRNIEIRGLGAAFTQVTLNGMEVPASTGGLDSSGGINRGRSFDFNVFPAELFTRIDVNKSSLASIEEGGVAGTVQMYTGRPLSLPGLRGSMLLQGGYNDLSEETDPRFTATFSNTNKANTLGFMISAAQMGRNSFQDGFGTVRFGRPDTPSSIPGSGFAANETSLSDQQLRQAWFPRLPRQDSFRHDQERRGLASSLQFRPNDRLDLNLNLVHSRFEATTESYNSFAQFRFLGNAGFRFITPTDVTLASQGNGQVAVAGTFRNVELRTESRQAEDETTFNQLTADFEYDISDNLILSGMVGRAQSEYEDLLFRVNMDSLPSDILFSYDFTRNSDVAAINYHNFDVTDPSNFAIQNDELLQKNLVDRTNDTARVDLDWFFGTGHSVRVGATYNEREVDSQLFQQDAAPPAVPLSSITRVFDFVDVGNYGSGTELRFLVLDFARARRAFDFGSGFVPFRGPGRATWVVTEETAGAYGEYNLVTLLGERALRLNLGARFVDTEVTALGWLSSTLSNTETNSYSNLLPALSVAFDVTPELLLRGSVSRTLTRPSLAALAPVKAYGNTNLTVTGGNSQLEPLLSDNVDLGAEWYFSEQSVLGLTLFYKDIDSFISTPETSEPLRPEDRAAVAAVFPTQPHLLDPSLIWIYRTSSNTEGTKMEGFEIAYSQAFRALPGLLSNFGFTGNYSYVDGETTVTRSGREVTVPLTGLSESSWNGTLYYEVPRWGARVSVNNRDDYITTNTGSNGNVSEATTGPIRWDMSAFWHFDERFSLSLEGINLTDEEERLYTTGDGTMNLLREINYSGRQFFLGVRWNL
jgi:TonB-dependent receptor